MKAICSIYIAFTASGDLFFIFGVVYPIPFSAFVLFLPIAWVIKIFHMNSLLFNFGFQFDFDNRRHSFIVQASSEEEATAKLFAMRRATLFGRLESDSDNFHDRTPSSATLNGRPENCW